MRKPSAFVAIALLAGLSTGSLADEPEPDPIALYEDDAHLAEHAEDVVDYTLDAKLDPTAHTVHGEGSIHWTNTSGAAVHELWVHLYLNAFKNERSVFLREPVGGFRGGEPVGDWGSIDVRSLVWNDGGTEVDLWKGAELHRDGDEDETDARVPLSRAIAPGESIDLRVVWDDKLPTVVERTGYHGSFHMVAQWFPKLARLEADGTWAHFPFHHLAEFYADYGTYDVTVRAPKGYVIGASGPPSEQREEGGDVVERHVQHDVHDFAWTAWDAFQTREETIAGVKVKVLFPPHFDADAERELATMRFALPYYGARYGKYPYDVLTIVHPPEGAGEAGGMEYPTLITTGGPWYGPPGILALELVTIHEFGHQYFYGLLGSNEVEWPFLDEGINSFAEQDAMREWRGEASVVDWPGLQISDSALHQIGGNGHADEAKVAQPAYAFQTGASYGRLVYSRTAEILETFRRVYGRDFTRAIGHYARRARFRHPVPDDLLTSFAEVLGEQAKESLRRALFEKATVDYEVTSLQANEPQTPAGLFDKDGKRETRTRTKEQGGEYEGWVLVTHKGALGFPVVVNMVAADGTTTGVTWDGQGESVRLPYRGPSALAYAIVDPEHRVLLDVDTTNNAKRSASASSGSSSRTFERVLYWAELGLGAVSP